MTSKTTYGYDIIKLMSCHIVQQISIFLYAQPGESDVRFSKFSLQMSWPAVAFSFWPFSETPAETKILFFFTVNYDKKLI